MRLPLALFFCLPDHITTTIFHLLYETAQIEASLAIMNQVSKFASPTTFALTVNNETYR
jgi:hypothetical protein